MENAIINSPTKFELNTEIQHLSANAWTLFDYSEARKQREFSGVEPKVNQTWGVPLWVCPPHFNSVGSVICLQISRNCSTNQRPGKEEFKWAWPKINQVWGDQLWVFAQNLSSIQLTVCLKMHQNSLTGNCGNSVEHDQKFIRSGESNIKFTYQVWTQFHQWFVLKRTETSKVRRTNRWRDKAIHMSPTNGVGRGQ